MSHGKAIARRRTRPDSKPSASGGHDPHKPIGYANPPKAGQFKKGRSGNPNGRPKGRKSIATILNERLYQKVSVREGGRERKVPLIEAKFMQLANAMLKGDEKATALMIRLFSQYGEPEQVQTGKAEPFSSADDQRLLEELIEMHRRDDVSEDK